MGLKHQHASQAPHPIDVGQPLPCLYLLGHLGNTCCGKFNIEGTEDTQCRETESAEGVNARALGGKAGSPRLRVSALLRRSVEN